MSQKVQPPAAAPADAEADVRKPEPEKAPPAEKPEDSLEEKDSMPKNFPFTFFEEPKPLWQGQLNERPIWSKFFQNEFEYQKYRSLQKTPEHMEDLRQQQLDQFNQHLWSIKPTYMPGDIATAIKDIQSQIVTNVENKQGISRFDVFTYSPEIFDLLDVKAFKLQEGVDLEDVNLGRMGSAMSKPQGEDIKHPSKSKKCDAVTKAIISSLKERLLENMIDTEEHYRETGSKKLSFISSEYMTGRLIQNMSCNLRLSSAYEKALLELGCTMENECQKEVDLERGYCGRCRQAACMVESIATNDLPAISYGLRFDYGADSQVVDQQQVQYHLNKGMVLHEDHWEVHRPEIQYNIGFYGRVDKDDQGRDVWEPEQMVKASVYDIPIPGFMTKNTNILRLFKAEAIEKVLEMIDVDEIDQAQLLAKKLTQKIYCHEKAEELAIKQQFFLVSASMQDMLENFKKQQLNQFLEEMRNVRRARSCIKDDDPRQEKVSTSSGGSEFEVQVQTDLFEKNYIKWEELSQFNQVHFTEQIPALVIVELLRILMDQENLDFDRAFNGIVSQMFSCTMYNLKRQLISVDLLGKVLPRHLDLIYLINFNLIEKKLKIDHPNKGDLYQRMSLIEESHPKSVRMDNLILHTCDKIDNANEAELDNKDFEEYHLLQVMKLIPGVSPRRWISCANPELGELITKTLKCNNWQIDMQKVVELQHLKDDHEFQEKFIQIKEANKRKLAQYIFQEVGLDVPYDNGTIYDAQISTPIKYSKRFLLNILYCIYRYIQIKNQIDELAKQSPPYPRRVIIFAGKTHNEKSDRIIELITQVSTIINNDLSIGNSLKIVFLPNYNVSLAELIIPACDVLQNLVAPGTEILQSTATMKALMNGCVILASKWGTNLDLEKVYHKHLQPKVSGYEIKEELDDMPIMMFGSTQEQLKMFQNESQSEYAPPEIREAVSFIQRTQDISQNLTDMIENIVYKGDDFFGITLDFQDYLRAQTQIDDLWMQNEVQGQGFVHKFVSLQIEAMAKSGHFSSDRTINQYQLQVWKMTSCTVPEPEAAEYQE